MTRTKTTVLCFVSMLTACATAPVAAGSFNAVTSIQRVNTVGGVAPSTGCGADSSGKAVRVPYTADYYFLTQQ